VPAAHRELVVPSASRPEFFDTLEHFTDFESELNYKYTVDTLSGVKIVFEHGWVNVNINSYDPNALQLICEADPFSSVNRLLDSVQQQIMIISESFIDHE
ncbi:MAG: hypothetical protein ACXAD7_26970, partial [Candidatus Kariarchaeaceae archaeon]